jgi:hypothetical protein
VISTPLSMSRTFVTWAPGTNSTPASRRIPVHVRVVLNADQVQAAFFGGHRASAHGRDVEGRDQGHAEPKRVARHRARFSHDL